MSSQRQCSRKQAWFCIVFWWTALILHPAFAPASLANDIPSTGSSTAWQLAGSNPAELMRRTLHNETANVYGYRPAIRYRLRKVTANLDTTKEVVETADGGVARLIAIGNRPLSSGIERREIDRLQALDGGPSIQVRRQRSEMQEAERMKKISGLLPAAFLFQQGPPVHTGGATLIRLTYAPNPQFHPPDFESRVLTGIRGEIWIDPEDLRIVHLESSTFQTVDFGWGLLGALYPGAHMIIEQAKTSSCGWQMVRLSLNMEGKALLFKSLHITVEETASGYHPAPRNWTYRDAIRWLLSLPATGPAD